MLISDIAVSPIVLGPLALLCMASGGWLARRRCRRHLAEAMARMEAHAALAAANAVAERIRQAAAHDAALAAAETAAAAARREAGALQVVLAETEQQTQSVRRVHQEAVLGYDERLAAEHGRRCRILTRHRELSARWAARRADRDERIGVLERELDAVERRADLAAREHRRLLRVAATAHQREMERSAAAHWVRMEQAAIASATSRARLTTLMEQAARAASEAEAQHAQIVTDAGAEAARIGAVLAFADWAARATEEQSVCDRAVALVTDLLLCDSAVMLEAPSPSAFLCTRAVAGTLAGRGRLPMASDGDGLPAYALRTDGPIASGDLLADARFTAPPALVAEGVRSALVIAMPSRGGTRRLLCAFAAEPRDFDEDARRLIGHLAAVLGLATARAAQPGPHDRITGRSTPRPIWHGTHAFTVLGATP